MIAIVEHYENGWPYEDAYSTRFKGVMDPEYEIVSEETFKAVVDRAIEKGLSVSVWNDDDNKLDIYTNCGNNPTFKVYDQRVVISGYDVGLWKSKAFYNNTERLWRLNVDPDWSHNVEE